MDTRARLRPRGRASRTRSPQRPSGRASTRRRVLRGLDGSPRRGLATDDPLHRQRCVRPTTAIDTSFSSTQAPSCSHGRPGCPGRGGDRRASRRTERFGGRCRPSPQACSSRGAGAAGRPLTLPSSTSLDGVLAHPASRDRPRPPSASPREGSARPCGPERLPSITRRRKRPCEHPCRLGAGVANSRSRPDARRRFARRGFPLWASPAAAPRVFARDPGPFDDAADRLLQQARDVDTSTWHRAPARGLTAASHGAPHAGEGDGSCRRRAAPEGGRAPVEGIESRRRTP